MGEINKSVLILGAGSIGGELARELYHQKLKITLCDNNIETLKKLKSNLPKLTIIEIDLLNISEIEDLILNTDFSLIIHSVGQVKIADPCLLELSHDRQFLLSDSILYIWKAIVRRTIILQILNRFELFTTKSLFISSLKNLVAYDEPLQSLLSHYLKAPSLKWLKETVYLLSNIRNSISKPQNRLLTTPRFLIIGSVMSLIPCCELTEYCMLKSSASALVRCIQQYELKYPQLCQTSIFHCSLCSNGLFKDSIPGHSMFCSPKWKLSFTSLIQMIYYLLFYPRKPKSLSIAALSTNSELWYPFSAKFLTLAMGIIPIKYMNKLLITVSGFD